MWSHKSTYVCFILLVTDSRLKITVQQLFSSSVLLRMTSQFSSGILLEGDDDDVTVQCQVSPGPPL